MKLTKVQGTGLNSTQMYAIAVCCEKFNSAFPRNFFFGEKNAGLKEYEKRWGIVSDSIVENDADETKKVLKKIEKVLTGHVMLPDQSFEVITDCLSRMKNSKDETKIFNELIKKVVEKVLA
ncbi:hypothetical protein [Lysinibacillus sp. BW-2-10]|uniref:hypothetical protein n=1 Tax=Lysinibacillus sp. BW-2-10 TaxID=2590030 RepID=UPI00117E6C23|nr:hypothetical protein [Lysinibacillus sp. BW-2-10]TSI05286.1 hypothetical protein FJQ64_13345 [Lysinibacillus sp. BW-2-10]